MQHTNNSFLSVVLRFISLCLVLVHNLVQVPLMSSVNSFILSDSYRKKGVQTLWICGTLSCNSLLFLTNCLVWFSLFYSITRLAFICHFLLHRSEEVEEFELPMNHGVRKHCLWEIAGMILITYEVILSFVLCIGTGSFVFEVQGFFVLLWCQNYPVFVILNWILGLFLTNCCLPQQRMKRSSFNNCCIVIINIIWRGLLYWCALNLLFHPRIHPEKEMGVRNLRTLNAGAQFGPNTTTIFLMGV